MGAFWGQWGEHKKISLGILKVFVLFCFFVLHQRSPGFGLTLVAETLDGSFLGAEMASTPQGQGDPVLPEDLGKSCAKRLLEEIHRVGAAKALRGTHLHTLSAHVAQEWTVREEKVEYVVLSPVGSFSFLLNAFYGQGVCLSV